jgi:hypothetical protein
MNKFRDEETAMIFAILCLLLLAGIVFFQSTQGLFSGLIMALCTLAATLVAFTYYEPLAAKFGNTELQFLQPLCLVLLTAVPLLVLRILMDKFLPGNVVPSMWVDRIGGGIFGLVTGLLLVGTLAVAAQMLPWGRGVASIGSGYEAFDDKLERQNSFLVDLPTNFTLGAVKLMSSAGAVRGESSFAMLHDDLVLEMWGSRNRDEEGGKAPTKTWARDEVKVKDVVRSPVLPDCLTVIKFVDATKQPLANGTFGTRAPLWPLDLSASEGRSHVYVARVTVCRDGADGDGWWRMRGTNFRLVTTDGSSYYPVGYLMRKGSWTIVEDPNGIGHLEINRPSSDKDHRLAMDWVYRVPNPPGSDQPRRPWFISFRRLANMPVGEVVEGALEGGGMQEKAVVGKVAVSPPQDSARGNFILHAFEAESTDDAPVKFAWGRREGEMKMNDANHKILGRLKDGRLAQGVIAGASDALAQEGKEQIREFYEPAGKHVLRLSCMPPQSEALQGLSSLKLITFAPKVQTQEGPSYPAVGAWAKWTEKNQEMYYLYYNPEPSEEEQITAGTMGGGKPFAAFTDIITSKAKNLSECGVLFLVPAKTTIVSFTFAENTAESTCESPMKVSKY